MTKPQDLDRRAFLRRSALASGALLVGPAALAACGGPPQSALAASDARALMDRLDRGLGRVRGIPQGDIARQLTWMARPDLSESVLRQTLEALVVQDVMRGLPQTVPGPLASRLHVELPVLGRSTETHHALLTRMPGSARRALDAKIRREPELPMEIAGWIDRHASELGTAPDSRLALRMSARDLKARLRHQSTNAVIDDCVAKVERAMAQAPGSLALGRSTRARAMIDAIWQNVDGGPTGHGGALTAPSGVPPAPMTQVRPGIDEDAEWARFMNESQQFWSARWRRPGDEEVLIGSVMMPFGAVSCGLMTIIGLIVLIAGAVQNGEWDGEPRDEPE